MITKPQNYQGRPLADWLLQLVDDSSEKRRAASRVILNRFYMPEELIVIPGVNPDDVVKVFQTAVHDAVRQPSFPATEYVRQMFSLCMALEQQRMEAWGVRNLEEKQWQDIQETKLGDTPTPTEVRRYLKRLCVRLRRDLEAMADEPVDESFDTGITIGFVLDCLGEELLPAAPLIRHMLTETHQSWIASTAIGRMGRTALEFYPDLVAGLERDDPNCEFSKPLGILLQHASEKIESVLQLTASGQATVRLNAIMALGHGGRKLMRKHPEVEARLLALIRDCSEKEWYACAGSLGDIAETPEAVALLLEATIPATGERVGAAIYALGKIGQDPHRVVPRLIALLREFQEPDPDYSMYGNNSRVVAALEAYGGEARIAIPALVHCIWGGPEQYYDSNGKLTERLEPDRSVIELLGKFGAVAREALPVLLEVKAELIRRSLAENISSKDEPVEPVEPDQHCPDYLSEAIQRINDDH